MPRGALIRLLPPSERHLDLCLSSADGKCPPLTPLFHERFPEDDPLAAIAP